MSKYNNFYSKDPFGIFKVESPIHVSGKYNFVKKSKPPVLKIIMIILLIIGIAAAFIFQDVILRFFFGETPQKKPSKPKGSDIGKDGKIQKTTNHKTESPEEGTGATIVE